MTIENKTNNLSSAAKPRSWVGGLVLIIVGVFFLLQQILDLNLGLYFLPGLALVFILSGLAARKIGLIIPGGILAGIGTGAALLEGPFKAVQEPRQGGFFLLAFAGGWVLITLLSLVLKAMDAKSPVAVWPLIPGSIIALTGGALVVGGDALKVMNVVGQGWPIILIAVGLYIVLRRKEIQN